MGGYNNGHWGITDSLRKKLELLPAGDLLIQHSYQHRAYTDSKFTELLRARSASTIRGIGAQSAKVIHAAFGVAYPWKVPVKRARYCDFPRLGEKLAMRLRPYVMDLRIVAGIYALKSKGKIMYVGQTINMMQRIAWHLSDKPTFDAVDFIESRNPDQSQLLRLERALILHFSPPWNGTGGSVRNIRN